MDTLYVYYWCFWDGVSKMIDFELWRFQSDGVTWPESFALHEEPNLPNREVSNTLPGFASVIRDKISEKYKMREYVNSAPEENRFIFIKTHKNSYKISLALNIHLYLCVYAIFYTGPINIYCCTLRGHISLSDIRQDG